MNKLLIISILFLFSCSQNQPIEHNNTAKQIKAAHYFSDAWPKTFWQEFELDKVDTDLEQIKTDGFNTIVLVIPWRGFEYGFSGSSTKSNSDMYQRLEFLLDAITEKNLDFILRIGFPHNYDPTVAADMAQTPLGHDKKKTA